jgi:hypothetical protein
VPTSPNAFGGLVAQRARSKQLHSTTSVYEEGGYNEHSTISWLDVVSPE